MAATSQVRRCFSISQNPVKDQALTALPPMAALSTSVRTINDVTEGRPPIWLPVAVII